MVSPTDLQAIMDQVSDRLADVYRQVGEFTVPAEQEAAKVDALDTLVALMQSLEQASERKTRVN